MTMLTKTEVEAIEPFAPDYEELWQDVLATANRVHLANGPSRAWAWHHMLLAVANFKAQLQMFPAPLPRPLTGEAVRRRDSLEVPVPGRLLVLRVDGPSTWRELSESIRGLGVPRTTTALSALWPGCHVIADWRALSAAAALMGARTGWDQTPVEPNSANPLRVDWESYSWYLQAVLDCAAQDDLHPLQIERALYTLGDAKPGATWQAYASWLEERLVSMCRGKN